MEPQQEPCKDYCPFTKGGLRGSISLHYPHPIMACGSGFGVPMQDAQQVVGMWGMQGRGMYLLRLTWDFGGDLGCMAS